MCCLGCCSSEPTQHDIVLSKGKRTCTDCSFLLIFLLFCCGLGTTTWFALSRGDPYRILYGSDSFGNTCGRTNPPVFVHPITGASNDDIRVQFELSGQDMTQRRFMFPLNITQPFDTVWTCIRECPQEHIFTASDLREQAEIHNNSLCVSTDASMKFQSENAGFGVCPRLPVMKSISIINRCIPEDILTVGQQMARKVVEMDFIRSYLSDIVVTSPLILKMCAVAFVMSLVTVYLLRFFAAVVIYFVYMMIVIVAAGISCALWYSVYLVHGQTIGDKTTITTRMPRDVNVSAKIQPAVAEFFHIGDSRATIESWFRFENTSELTLLGLAIGATVITVFIAVVVWCLFPRGKKMVELFKKASMALASMPILLFQPIISAIFVVLIAMYSISSGLVLYTAGEPFSRTINDGSNSNITIIETNMTSTTRFMLFYQLAGFIWLSEFVMACQRLFIAGSISLWYFNSRRSDPGETRSAVCSSMYNVARFHLGTAAVGSFIITLVRLPRYILMWIYAKMRAVENPIAGRILACFICILSCIEKCLDYINYNAYTVVAYSGMSFCPAAKVAVNVLLDNAVDVATVNSVGDAVLFLSKCIVGALTATIALFQIKADASLSHPWLPVLIVFICSYLIANCFLSVYEMAIDTLLLCSAEDEEMSRENPQHEFSNGEFKDMVHMTSMGQSRSVDERHSEEQSTPLRRPRQDRR